MRRTYLLPLMAAGALLVTACGDSGTSSGDTKTGSDTMTDVLEDTSTPVDTSTTDSMVDDTAEVDTTETDTMVEDTMVEDTMVEDTMVEDTMVEDTMVEDTMVEDTMVEDTTEADTTEADTTETDTSTQYDPSAQITAVRGGTAGAIEGAFVTYVKTEIGGDSAGFFVQGDDVGPALFIGVAADSLSPVPAVGDMVSFTVDDNSTETGNLPLTITSISGFSVLSTGNDLSSLVQDVSAADDLDTALDDYESELVTATVTLTGDFHFAGSGFQQADVDTAGVTGGDISFRVPNDDPNMDVLEAGCVIDVGPVPVWHYSSTTQLSVDVTDDYEIVSCPAPELVSASAVSSTEVTVTFSRKIAVDSVATDGSDFTIDNGVTVTAAAVSDKMVTLTVSELTAGTYTVTVGAAVTDTFAKAVSIDANSATFDGPTPAPDLVFTELMPRSQSGADSGEYIEIHNTTDTEMNLSGKSCQIEDSGGVLVDSTTFDAVTIPAGGYALFVKSVTDFSGITTDGLFNGSLGNSGETLTLSCDFGGGVVTIDALSSYGGGLTAGQSIQKDPGDGTYAGPTDPTGANWCLTPTTDDTYLYFDDGAGTKKYGTPKAANVTCGN